MMILIAGPYRSGTNDDPEKIGANVHVMESFAIPIFKKGHVPMLGEWLALPLLRLAGSKKIGDEIYDELFHPAAEMLLDHCNAVLRVGGSSEGADRMVEVARQKGLKIYYELDEIPNAERQ